MSIKIETLGGNCPVQGEGTIDGVPFYFRARGEHWTLSVSKNQEIGSEADWMVRIRYSRDTFGAGWMTEDEARRLIYIGAQMYQTAKINNTIIPSEPVS